MIRLVAVRIGRPVFVVFVPLPGPMLKIFAAGCCALNWNAFGGGVGVGVGVGALNENDAGVAAGAVAGPPNANDFEASAVLFGVLKENEVPIEKRTKRMVRNWHYGIDKTQRERKRDKNESYPFHLCCQIVVELMTIQMLEHLLPVYSMHRMRILRLVWPQRN